jgi:hypothetical protein
MTAPNIMPVPTHEQIVAVLNEVSEYSKQLDHMRNMGKNTSGEVCLAYKTIADDFAFKILRKINNLWLYMNDSLPELY